MTFSELKIYVDDLRMCGLKIKTADDFVCFMIKSGHGRLTKEENDAIDKLVRCEVLEKGSY